MKHLHFFKKINFWYIIASILIISLAFSFYLKINKPYSSNVNELLKLLDKLKDNTNNSNEKISISSKEIVTVKGIKKITPYISYKTNPYTIDLEVEYIKINNGNKKITYFNISKKEYEEIQNKIRENENNDNFNSIQLLGYKHYEPNFGLNPFFSAVRMCSTLILIYFIFDSFKHVKNQLSDHLSDKNKLEKNKNVKKQTVLTFKNIAGAEEEKEEMQELVDFLKNPQKYSLMGARIPKGVLLSGPPGTGKTLLAKALAGEAKVPFFAVSGSEFVEMFVGLGAARIRNLFKKSQNYAPCIIFIDEIETLARKRGSSFGNTEQEQTLNQLLIELDGFNSNKGVIVIAATNQPDLLDSALLRPGRLERRFNISLPSVKDREAILRLHSLNKKFSPDVDLTDLAKETPGFSGAQLEGILNEAALLTIRTNSPCITKQIISEAVDRLLMGPSKKSRRYSKKEKKLVSIHESGHAVASVKLLDAKRVQKITIIPRGDAGGYNLMLDKEETFFSSKKKLLSEITVLLSGRAAEELFLDDISNGAYQDLQMATQIANKMVTLFGMSDLGLVQFDSEKNTFHRNFSDPKALEIDETVQKIIFNCYETSKKIISENKELLFNISNYLLELETLNRKDIEEIYKTGKISWFEEQKEKVNNSNLDLKSSSEFESKE